MEQFPGSETSSSLEPPETIKSTTRNTKPPEAILGPDITEELIPWLDSMEPSSLAVPGRDTEVLLTGGNFKPGVSQLVWNNEIEPANFIDANTATTIVKPSTVQAPLPFSLPVVVRNGDLESNQLTFTFVQGEPPPEPPQ